MPRKATKTAPEAAKPADQGVDSPFAQWAQETPENEPPKKKIGRPSKYTPELAQEICERLANGEPLRQICRDEHMPAWQKIYEWMWKDDSLGDRGVGLSGAIARAREIGQEAIAEQIWIDMYAEPERILSEGGGRIDSGYVQLIKARAEIGLKLLAKWNPKRYGDKITHAGDPEAPLQVNNDAMALLAAAVENLELKRKA